MFAQKNILGCQQLTIKAEFDRVMINRENEIYLDKLYYIHPANLYWLFLKLHAAHLTYAIVVL